MKLLLTSSFLIGFCSVANAAPPPVDSDDWNVMSPYKEWVTSQHDSLGRWCCDIGDGRPVAACQSSSEPKATYLQNKQKEFIRNKDGELIEGEPTDCNANGENVTWWVHLTKTHFPKIAVEAWKRVPDDKVNHKTNPTGLPIVWVYEMIGSGIMSEGMPLCYGQDCEKPKPPPTIKPVEGSPENPKVQCFSPPNEY